MERLADPLTPTPATQPDARETRDRDRHRPDARRRASASSAAARPKRSPTAISKSRRSTPPNPGAHGRLLHDYLPVAGHAPARRSTASEPVAAPHGFDLEEPLFEVRNHVAALDGAVAQGRRRSSTPSFSPRLDYYTGIVFEMTGSDGEDPGLGRRVRPPARAAGRHRAGRGLGLCRSGSIGSKRRRRDDAGLTLAVPSKGRLEELTRDVLRRRRLTIARPGGARSYVGSIKNQPQVTVRFYPAAEIARELILGGIDIGVTGSDLIHEASENGRENVIFASRSASARPTSSSPCPTPGSTSRRWPTSPTSPPTSAPATAAGCASPPNTSISRAALRRRTASPNTASSRAPARPKPRRPRAPPTSSSTSPRPGATLAANELRVLEDGLIMKSRGQPRSSRAPPTGRRCARPSSKRCSISTPVGGRN